MPEPSFDANAYQAEQGREWGRSAAGWKQHWDIWEKGAQHINARLVELAHLQPGHVVDITTGWGETAFTAARQVEPTGQVIGTDIAPEMLAIARAEAKALGLSHVDLREMDAEAPAGRCATAARAGSTGTSNRSSPTSKKRIGCSNPS